MGSRWLPLEANPEVMNEVHIRFDHYEEFRKAEEERLRVEGNQVPTSVYFLRQTIGNACGTIGILHALGNNLESLKLDLRSLSSPYSTCIDDGGKKADGPLKRIMERGKEKSAEERGAQLENDEDLARVHDESSREGQTAAPNQDEEVDLHFVAIIEKEGQLFEMDGRKPFPINHGPADDLLNGAVQIIKKFMSREPVQPSAMSFPKAAMGSKSTVAVTEDSFAALYRSRGSDRDVDIQGMRYKVNESNKEGTGSGDSLHSQATARSKSTFNPERSEKELDLSDIKYQTKHRVSSLDEFGSGDYIPTQPFFQTVFRQLWVMITKNTILQARYYKTTLAQAIIAPAMFMCLLYGLQQIDYAKQRIGNRNPPASVLNGISQCQGTNPGDPCINIMYAKPPDIPKGIYTSDLYDGIMTKFATINSGRTGEDPFVLESPINELKSKPTRRYDIVPITNADFLYDYVLLHPNTTNWGVIFKCNDSEVMNIQYEIWYNASQTLNDTDVLGRSIVSLMRGIDEAIISQLNYPNGEIRSTINITMKDWPVVPALVVSDRIVQSVGPIFFFCSMMVIFINIINQILMEKELKLRHAMEMMGLKTFVYWTSHIISHSVVIFSASCTTVILGYIFQFKAFVYTEASVLLLVFFLYAEAMMFFGFFITSLLRRARVGVLVGIFIFIVGLLFQSFVFSVLMLLPFFNFGKIFLDIMSLTTGKLDVLTSTYIPGPGFPWSSLFQPIPKDFLPIYPSGSSPAIPLPIGAVHNLLANIAIYGVLTWYFDNVIPNEYGYYLPPWTDKTVSASDWLRRELSFSTADAYQDADEDDDVRTEREATCSVGTSPEVKIVNIRKVYQNSIFKTKVDKVAVQSLCISMKKGKLLALLGQNGAGKSTTMNILSGLTKSTSGDAHVFGYSVRTQMNSLRKIMGVCPQHDILFNDLTAREHILLYAGLKGVPQKMVANLLEARLEAVRLHTVANQRAGTYSGGMKRRLSMVISTIGDPKIIYLDEPTTGMDPVNRRHVWSFIENFKKDRVIVLTTHSMEEADILGDRIAVMSHGRLRAIGTSLALKRKKGAGYRISLVVDPHRTDEAKAAVFQRISNATLEDDAAGSLIYQFSGESSKSIPKFIKYLDENPEGLVKAWGISQTTLETVDINGGPKHRIRDANEEKLKRDSIKSDQTSNSSRRSS
ncbi:ATP-binding cassette sub- A member 1 [Dinochytrium kinnereticum]|nr:ATP-binding cassette sub- A member 1 [Dinochytrium kinnereticum]